MSPVCTKDMTWVDLGTKVLTKGNKVRNDNVR